jgi:hypothetical protein
VIGEFPRHDHFLFLQKTFDQFEVVFFGPQLFALAGDVLKVAGEGAGGIAGLAALLAESEGAVEEAVAVPGEGLQGEGFVWGGRGGSRRSGRFEDRGKALAAEEFEFVAELEELAFEGISGEERFADLVIGGGLEIAEGSEKRFVLGFEGCDLALEGSMALGGVGVGRGGLGQRLGGHGSVADGLFGGVLEFLLGVGEFAALGFELFGGIAEGDIAGEPGGFVVGDGGLAVIELGGKLVEIRGAGVKIRGASGEGGIAGIEIGGEGAELGGAVVEGLGAGVEVGEIGGAAGEIRGGSGRVAGLLEDLGVLGLGVVERLAGLGESIAGGALGGFEGGEFGLERVAAIGSAGKVGVEGVGLGAEGSEVGAGLLELGVGGVALGAGFGEAAVFVGDGLSGDLGGSALGVEGGLGVGELLGEGGFSGIEFGEVVLGGGECGGAGIEFAGLGGEGLAAGSEGFAVGGKGGLGGGEVGFFLGGGFLAFEELDAVTTEEFHLAGELVFPGGEAVELGVDALGGGEDSVGLARAGGAPGELGVGLGHRGVLTGRVGGKGGLWQPMGEVSFRNAFK